MQPINVKVFTPYAAVYMVSKAGTKSKTPPSDKRKLVVVREHGSSVLQVSGW